MRRSIKGVLSLIAKHARSRQGYVTIGARSFFLFYKLHMRRGCDVRVGNDCDLHCRISFDREQAKVAIGDRCYIGASHIVCANQVLIGNDVIVSWGVTIVDHNSHTLDWSGRAHDVLEWKTGQKDWAKVRSAPVRIEDKVWIGFNASILKGVTIGEGAVIAAGAMVSRDVPPYTVVAGNPGRVIGRIDGDTIRRDIEGEKHG